MSNYLTQSQNAGIMDFSKFENAWKACEFISKSSFCPKDFRGKPGDVLCAIQYGCEIGLLPMQALQGVAVINGKPSVWGDTLLALCQSSSECEYILEEYDEKSEIAICRAKRKNHPEIVRTFSRLDASKAALWNKEGPWRLYPKRMLQMRARGFCLRDAFAYLLRGIITVEEARDYPSIEGNSQKIVPIVPEVDIKDTIQITTRSPLNIRTRNKLFYVLSEIEKLDDCKEKESDLREKILSWAKVECMEALSEQQALSVLERLEKKYPEIFSDWEGLVYEEPGVLDCNPEFIKELEDEINQKEGT